MTRKLIGLGMLTALTSGVVAVAACVATSDHTAPVPAAVRSSGEPKGQSDADGTAADLTNWQEVRVVITGSKFR